MTQMRQVFYKTVPNYLIKNLLGVLLCNKQNPNV